MEGEQYGVVSGDDGFLKGGYKSQLLDDHPWNYIGISQLTEDLPRDVNSYGKISGRFESSVSERTSRHVISTRRGPIPFGAGEERKYPKIIRWGKVWEVEDGNGELNDGTAAVEL